MKTFKIADYSELENLKEVKESEFIINLNDCQINKRKDVINFLTGLTFMNGSLKKINSNEFEVKIVK